ncbi:hypothetical protein [Methylicorpusculum sp.]|uniref:hypothetical protein n=1 Tax=Methylicorpusculum sp. TaxID=2713644 RepID=UPI00273017DA|nr:hypothetical protein [Methylicorpusculum sp.]MDP3531543.1 hypothetical protein [Methylicorpusculum sp.]MDZ4149957.1 hypothetical protein [Methylicorpusculum sp.]
MERYYEIFEMVVVTHNSMLFDSESYLRKYCTSHGEQLVFGNYVVNWPDHIRIRRFNEHAEFYGPFKTRKEAQATLDWMYDVYRQYILRLSVNDRCKTWDSVSLSMINCPERTYEKSDSCRFR